MLAVDNASVRLARSHVHTGMPERLHRRTDEHRRVTVRWSRYGHAAGPARRAVGVRRNPCRLTSSACGANAFFAARRASWRRPLQLVRALLGCAGSGVDRPVVGPLYRHDRTVTRGGNRSAEPVWTRGWPSQTRRRPPEKSVQTDQLGLRGECVLRRTARFLARPASARPRSFSRSAGSRVDRPVVGPPYRHGRTLTPTVSVRASRYPALRQSGKHRRTASRSGPGLSLRRDIRPVLAVDNASVRLARSHVHTGMPERLPPTKRRPPQLGDPDIVVTCVVKVIPACR